MTDPGPLWHEEGLTHFDPSPRKLMLDQDSVVVPRAAYMLGNLLSKAAGVCTGVCQVPLPLFSSIQCKVHQSFPRTQQDGRPLTKHYFSTELVLLNVYRTYASWTAKKREGCRR